MDNILSHYIVNLLLTQGKAFLPRVGVLTLENVSAEILPNTGKINPPRKRILFGHSDRIDRQDLYDQFLKWRDLDSDSAKELSHKFEDEFHRRLIKGSINIQDIGTFTNTEMGIAFEQDVYSSYFNPLPTLELKDKKATKVEKVAAASSAISDISMTKSGAEEKPESIIKEPKKRNKSTWWLWLLLVLALLFIIGTAVGAYLLYGGKSKSDDIARSNSDTEIQATINEVDDPKTTEIDGVNYENPDLIDNEVKSEDFDDGNGSADNSSRAENDVETADSDGNAGMGEDTGETIINNRDQDQPIDTDTDLDEETVKTPDGRTPTQVDIEDNNISGGIITGNCIVIVGAFGNDRNVQKMKSKIEKLGYESYSDVKGRLTRVGLRTPCDKKELLKNLRYARNQIEAKSWIL